jgi:hypothetical protein
MPSPPTYNYLKLNNFIWARGDASGMSAAQPEVIA